ncbi:hypothetical protein NADFUDRAFT_49292 [Nadsonia fulvescens var. elongata DSM 6958]|uniref:Swiss Army Knife RNA repair protein HAD domain-containing protein n=1 Tax=Nadsonia fulvescens var. elongata DSM 6958 TaxID=857566 RepID=A0A1E3PUM1_9ASCO|nr:hypothetical protein NADFUDRAFT_49292 [Nadsonia fulvescens var. elongata DSM 6958]
MSLVDNPFGMLSDNPLNIWDTEATRVRPSVDLISQVHIYDFDNTIFKTPLPNPSLFHGNSIVLLQSSNSLHQGGWWADPKFLISTGEGFEIESGRAWQGWWNENIVDLARLSIADPNVLTIIMTGRKHHKFATCVSEMVNAKNLTVDGVILRRGDAENTLAFKVQVMRDLLNHYTRVTDITIYDDRPKQAHGFRQFLHDYTLTRRPNLIYDVILVFEETKYLSPVSERNLVASAIAAHNDAVKKGLSHASIANGRMTLRRSLFYTAYLIDQQSTVTLLKKFIPAQIPEAKSIRYHADSIVICRGACSKSLLANIGGYGHEVEWQVTHFGSHDNKVWAVKVRQVRNDIYVRTEITPPLIVLAVRRRLMATEAAQITKWTELDNSEKFVIKTRVGEKALLKIEPEDKSWKNKKNKK